MIEYLKRNISDKNFNFYRNTFYNYITSGLNIVLNLLLIPLLLNVLGKESFGIWQTLLSIISFASVLNFGLGNGLRNLITKLIADDKKDDLGRAIGSTFLKSGKIIVLTSLLLFPIICFFFKPEKLFIDRIIAIDEIRLSFFIFLFFFLVNILLSMSNSIAYGLQKSYLTGIVQFLNLLICYCLIYTLNLIIEVNLIHISFIFGFTQSVSYLIFLLYQNSHFKLKIEFKKKYDLKETTKLSSGFFLAQLLALIYLSIDNFVISSTLGASQTAEFSVVNKMFFSLIGLFSIFLIHFWNSVTEAFQKEEIMWIFKTVKHLFVIAFCFFFVSLIMSYFQKDIITIWIKDSRFSIQSETFYLFSIYLLLHCINAIFVNLQNGLGFLKIQICSSILGIIIYLLGCYFIDIKMYGYNIIIILKIGSTLLSLLMNSSIILILKKYDYTNKLCR
jgi:O-antigen/teichoic acid export membrane protein